MKAHSSPQIRGSLSFLAAVIIVLVTGLAGGCAQRTLKISTEPSGALVLMDNREIGRTPIEMPFVYGGVREFLILKDERGPDTGPMKPLIVRQDLENFWFDTFPFDIFVELSPLAIEDVREFHFVLEPSDTLASYRVDPDAYSMALKARAVQMKMQARDTLEAGFPGSGVLQPEPASQDAPTIPTEEPNPADKVSPSSSSDTNSKSKSKSKSESTTTPSRP